MTSSYLIEERVVTCNIINDMLKEDTDLKDRIPMDSATDDMFHAMEDGKALCKLINCCEPDTIDERAINMGAQLNVY